MHEVTIQKYRFCAIMNQLKFYSNFLIDKR